MKILDYINKLKNDNNLHKNNIGEILEVSLKDNLSKNEIIEIVKNYIDNIYDDLSDVIKKIENLLN